MAVTPATESARRARLAAAEEDDFWREHYDTYLERYPDAFVAVTKANGQFVAADPDLDSLIGKVTDKGLDVQRVWVRYMAATPIRLAL